MAATVLVGGVVLVLGASSVNSSPGAAGPEPGLELDAKRNLATAASGAVENGSLFAVWWEDYCELSCYSVWRGGPEAPFRRLRVSPEGTPCISQDGSRLAYAGKRRSIVVQRISPRSDELGPPKVIARLPRGQASAPPDCAWSPNGHSLVLVGYGNSVGLRSEGSVWRLERDGTGLRKLSEVPGNVARYPGDPAWSSTGQIAFASGGERAWMAMVDSNGGNMRRLGLPRGHSPAWSPDGRQLAFVNSAGAEYESIWPGPVMVADANGEDVRRLRRGQYGAVAFSPNGRRIAFAHSFVPPRGSDRVEITRTDGTTIRTLPVAHKSIFAIRLTWTNRAGAPAGERPTKDAGALLP